MATGGRRRDYRAEYARRVAKGRAAGKTRQQARGHVPQEHVVRRRREREENEGLSYAEEARIRAWCDRYPNEEKRPQDDVVEFARYAGYAAFVQYRKTWNAARSTYLRERRNGTYASRGEGYLRLLTNRAGVEEMSWLYYH